MSNIDCRKCINWEGRCRYSMRAAATANGAEPEDETEVYFCHEFEEPEEYPEADDDWED